MKYKEFKNLIIKSLGKENDDGKITLELLEQVNYDFDINFVENVIAKIINKGKIIRYDFERQLKFAFSSVSIAASVAIILLATSIFLQAGSLSVDSLLGVEDDYSESIVCVLMGD